jgi:hypothetical protein
LRWLSYHLCGPKIRQSTWWVVLVLHLTAVAAVNAESALHLRVHWSGPKAILWEGRIWLSMGTVSQAPARSETTNDTLETRSTPNGFFLRQSSPTTSNGVDLLLRAPQTAILYLQLQNQGSHELTSPIEIPVENLLVEVKQFRLDDRGTRLEIRRAPGDTLKVQTGRSTLIFEPGEEIPLQVFPNSPGIPPYAAIRFTTELLEARGSRTLTRKDINLEADYRGDLPLIKPYDMRLPFKEGVYDLVFRLDERPRKRFSIPRSERQTFATQRIQVVVLDRNRPGANHFDEEENEIDNIDPANPRWWEFLTKPLNNLPRLGNSGPANNGKSSILHYQDQAWLQLDPQGWQTYPLQIERPSKAHVLEIAIPQGITQNLTIHVSEPGSQQTNLITGHSVLKVPGDAVSNQGQQFLHRFVFWPQNESSQVVLTNEDATQPAIFGKIRVTGLPMAKNTEHGANPYLEKRELLAFFQNNSFVENFCATTTQAEETRSPVRDWQTYYEAGTRLTQFLRQAGYSRAILTVDGDDGVLYPSRLTNSTHGPVGDLPSSSASPIGTPDVLEMLFHLFDREGIQLVPAFRFSNQLTALRTSTRQAGVSMSDIELVGAAGPDHASGASFSVKHNPRYNPLDPRVQAAMLAVIRELTERYGNHSSFGGIALDLSVNGNTLLPGAEWALDDRTVRSFEQATSTKLSVEGKNRYAERAAVLRNDSKVRSEWLTWRAAELSSLLQRMRQIASLKRPKTKLLLVTSDLLSNQAMTQAMRPSLPVKGDDALVQKLLEFGIDMGTMQKQSEIVLVRPRVPTSFEATHSAAVPFKIDELAAADRIFGRNGWPASFLIHQPAEIRKESLSATFELSPASSSFRSPAWLSSVGWHTRSRFARSLARLDAQLILEGGTRLPCVLDPAVTEFLQTYRQLPAAHFTSVRSSSIQPVVIRKFITAGKTCLYLVNDSPWKVKTELQLDVTSSTRIESLGPNELPPLVNRNGQTWWQIELEPYQLIAGWVAADDVNLRAASTTIPEHVERDMKIRIEELHARRRALKSPPKLKRPANSGFEEPLVFDDVIPHWVHNSRHNMGVELTFDGSHEGNSALHMWNRPESGAANWCHSSTFTPPRTGRLATWVFLRCANDKEQPELRLILEAIYKGASYYRFAEVGKNTTIPLHEDWKEYIFAIDDLPREGLTELRVGFDLMGPGDVWIDELQTFDLSFRDSEQHELAKLIALADKHLRVRNFSDCARILDSYWPRFLEQHVTLPPSRMANRELTPKIVPTDREIGPAEEPGFFEQLKGWTRKLPWF